MAIGTPTAERGGHNRQRSERHTKQFREKSANVSCLRSTTSEGGRMRSDNISFIFCYLRANTIIRTKYD